MCTSTMTAQLSSTVEPKLINCNRALQLSYKLNDVSTWPTSHRLIHGQCRCTSVIPSVILPSYFLRPHGQLVGLCCCVPVLCLPTLFSPHHILFRHDPSYATIFFRSAAAGRSLMQPDAFLTRPEVDFPFARAEVGATI